MYSKRVVFKPRFQIIGSGEWGQKSVFKKNSKGDFVLLFQTGNHCIRYHDQITSLRNSGSLIFFLLVPNQAWFSLSNLSLVKKELVPPATHKLLRSGVFVCHAQSTCGEGMLRNKCVSICKSEGYIDQSVYSGYLWMTGNLFPLYLTSKFSTLSFLCSKTTN